MRISILYSTQKLIEGLDTRLILFFVCPFGAGQKHEVLGAIQLINHFVVEKEPVFREDGTVEKEIETRHFVPFDEKHEITCTSDNSLL